MQPICRTQEEVEEARERASIHVLATDLSDEETSAFDVTVDRRGVIGRWSQKNGVGGSITWDSGGSADTGDCDLDRDKIAEAVRWSIPYRVEPRPGVRRRLLDRLRSGGRSADGGDDLPVRGRSA